MKLRYIGLPVLLLLGACKAPASATAAPSDGEAMDRGGGAYRDEEVVLQGEREEMAPSASPMTAARPKKRGKFERRRAARDARSEMASPAPAEPDTAVTGAVEDGRGSDEAEPAIATDDNPDLDGRHIVYTAQMTVSVFNLEEATANAEAMPETYGGYLQSMSQGNIVLRIPSKNLRPAMDALAEFGVVDSRSLQTADVTAEFTDIDSRIRALEETQKQLLALLGKARTVKEALEVRRALDEINSELEVLKGRMRQLQNQISYSTLTVTLYERGPHAPVPSSNDPFPWVNNLGVESTEWK